MNTEVARLPDAPIARMAHAVGAKSVGSAVYGKMRELIAGFVEGVVRSAAAYAKHAKRRRIMKEDVTMALDARAFKRYTVGAQAEDMEACSGEGKQKECLYLPKSVFADIIRAALSSNTLLILSSHAAAALQKGTELYVMDVLEGAAKLAAHAGREVVGEKDVELALWFRK